MNPTISKTAAGSFETASDRIYLRASGEFDSVEALVAQMRLDVEDTRRWCG